MADGIAKGIGEQLVHLGKQIVTEVAQVPAKIAGMDGGSTNEAVGMGTGSAKQQASQKNPQGKPAEKVDPLAGIRQKDEIEKQKQLAAARRLIQQFAQPQQAAPTLKQQQEMEEYEKRKKEIAEEKKKNLPQVPHDQNRAKQGEECKITID